MTIMTRGGAERWWKIKPPPDVKHYWHDGAQLWGDQKPKWNVHTWTMEHAKRTERIRHREEIKRRYGQIIPCYVWVFHVDSWIMGGWYIYIKTRTQDYALNFRQTRPELVSQIMAAVPCGFLFPDFQLWAPAFAREYAHIGFNRKKNQGLLKARCEIDECGKLVNVFIYGNRN